MTFDPMNRANKHTTQSRARHTPITVTNNINNIKAKNNNNHEAFTASIISVESKKKNTFWMRQRPKFFFLLMPVHGDIYFCRHPMNFKRLLNVSSWRVFLYFFFYTTPLSLNLYTLCAHKLILMEFCSIDLFFFYHHFRCFTTDSNICFYFSWMNLSISTMFFSFVSNFSLKFVFFFLSYWSTRKMYKQQVTILRGS